MKSRSNLRPPSLVALSFVILVAGNAAAALAGGFAPEVAARRTAKASRRHAHWRPQGQEQQPASGQSPAQSQPTAAGCAQDQKLDLSGTYRGVYYLDKDDKEGTPAVLKISGEKFELTSVELKGEGAIAAINTCGETKIALRFNQAAGEEEKDLAALLESGISLTARVAGVSAAYKSNVQTLGGDRAVVLATTVGRNGQLAGADIAFVICPDHPKCKRYPRCPCPEPQP